MPRKDAVKDRAGAPALAPLPPGADRRLIDEGMLQYDASDAGFAERYRRGETPHTIHVWWARRPHSAMRALVHACLLPAQAEWRDEWLDRRPLLADPSTSIDSRRLLDMFGGSGTIGFEAACLGASVSSIDTNQLAVFIQRNTLLHFPRARRQDLRGLVRITGESVLRNLAIETAPLFPHRGRFFGYLWTYATKCRSCGFLYYLTKRPWLSKKNGRRVAMRLCDGDWEQSIEVTSVPSDYQHPSCWGKRGASATCPKCGTVSSGLRLDDCAERLVAEVGHAPTNGKMFAAVESDAIPPSGVIAAIERRALHDLDAGLPTSKLPLWSGIVNPAIYGIETHADFLNARQRAVLVSLIRILREEHQAVRRREGTDVALAVTSFLSGLIDQLIDWNCRLSMWIPQNEQVGRAFCGPGIAMLWDYVETDPLERGPANLHKKLSRIISGMESLQGLRLESDIRLASAQELPYKDSEFDAIVTDPPYYDNLYYCALADFFYSWKRLLFQAIEPELFSLPQTNELEELVASTKRSGSPDKAHDDYCHKLRKALREAERVLKPEGVFAMVYSHSSLRGWQALVDAYRSTRLVITSVQPLNIERKQRPRAMTSDTINTCMVFVARRSDKPKRSANLQEMCCDLRNHCANIYSSLSGAGWHPSEIAVAMYAQGVAMACNASELSGGIDDTEVLQTLAGVVREWVPAFTVVDRKPL